MYPDKVLRKKTEKVFKVDKKLIEETEELKKILMNSENGAGLAAPQIGISKKFLGIKEKGTVKILINPKLEKIWGEKVYPKVQDENGVESDFLEGCLSFPDLYGTVKRYLKIEASWEEIAAVAKSSGEPKEDFKLVKKSGILEGFGAIVWQHENDHLEGILFVDHVKEEGGKFYLWEDKEKVPMNVDEVLKKEK
jgi:peptide deformylase